MAYITEFPPADSVYVIYLLILYFFFVATVTCHHCVGASTKRYINLASILDILVIIMRNSM